MAVIGNVIRDFSTMRLRTSNFIKGQEPMEIAEKADVAGSTTPSLQ